MKRLLTVIVISALSIAVSAQTSIKDRMEQLSGQFGVNFVYDPVLPVNVPCQESALVKRSLEESLDALFENSGISWQKKRRYIVLTPAAPDKSVSEHPVPARISFQMDTITAASITGKIDRSINFTQTGLTKIDGAAFRRGFAVLSSPDVLKTLQALPGVASGAEMLSNLYVHGGDGSDNLFLLDGVPLYQICHLGGVFSAFNTDVIDHLDFYKSGFPARYGGRISSVVDITTKEGDYQEYKGLFTMGLLEGRIQFEGPIVRDRTSFNIALRRTWADALMYPVCLMNGESGSKDGVSYRNTNLFLYSFTDFNASVTHKFSENHRLSARLYIGNDDFKKSEGSFTASDWAETTNSDEMLMDWGNVLASLDWQKQLTSKCDMRITGYWSGSRSVIETNDLAASEVFSAVESAKSISHEERNYMSSHSVLDDLGLKADFNWNQSLAHHIRGGAECIRHSYRPDYGYGEYISGESNYDTFLGDTIRASGCEASLYAEDEITLSRWLKVNMGLRNTVYAAEGNVWSSLEPRLAMKFRLTPDVSIKASYAEMSQFSHLVATTYLDLPANCWLPSGNVVAPMRSKQVAGGIYSTFPHNLHLNVEAWYKTMDNLVEYNGLNSLFVRLDEWQENFKIGKGRSYGVEVDGGYEGPALSLNVFYTLSWNERYFEDFWQDWYPDRNDNRHKLTFQANWRVNGKIELYSAWNYHSGNRMTVPTQALAGIYASAWYSYLPFARWFYEEPNNIKLPDYHRLDVGLNINGKSPRGRDVVWNVSIYNVYCRINTFYATFKLKDNAADGTETYVLLDGAGYGFIPIVPTFSYTLKF